MTLHYFFLPATRVKFMTEVARATRNQLGMAGLMVANEMQHI